MMADRHARYYGEGAPGWAEVLLGRAALSDAEQLSASNEGVGTGLLLYRAAVILFRRAHTIRGVCEPGAPSGSAEPAAFSALVSELPSEQRTLVQGAFDGSSGEVYLAGLSEAQRELAGMGMRVVARGLRDSLQAEVDAVRGVGSARVWPMALGVAVVLASAIWPVLKLTSRQNLALDKTVVVTSAEPRIRARPRALVDGDRKSLGFHTKKLQGQSATIDLGRVEPIRSVEVYNRIDCCQARAVPLRLELSVDGAHYTTIERRTEPFLSWKVSVPQVEARFVRLSHEGRGFFHLTEVEVY
jgi:hypothetical protein